MFMSNDKSHPAVNYVRYCRISF